MQLVCDQCQATYELDPPAAPFARDQNLVFRCTACGHSIPMRKGEPEKPSSVLDVPDRTEPEQQGFLLRQEGKLYQVKDAAMLQRWIAERRIWRTDEISEDGLTWRQAEQIEGCAVFFDLVDQAEQASSTSTSSGKGLFAKPQNMNDPLSAIQMPEGDSDEIADASPSTVDATEAFPEEDTLFPEDGDLADPDEDTSIVEVEEAQPLRLAVEAIPEEEPAALPKLDEPTMDMDLGEEDFFSEEQADPYDGSAMDSGGGDYDDDLEWMQAKRKSMITWWLLFFGALGGAGYFALDFLNQQDSKPSELVAEPGAEPKAGEPLPAPPEAVVSKEKGDSGDAGEPQAAEAETEEEQGAEIVPPVEPPPPAVEVESPPPAAVPSQPAAPARVNPGREVDRGWAKIDRENWSAARTHFNNALAADPGNGDAKFGLAYVDENEGRVDDAVRQYCRLQTSGAGEAKAEASGRLRALGRDCP